MVDAWTDAHRVLFAVARQAAVMDEHTAKKLWSKLWSKYSQELLAKGFDPAFQRSWQKLVKEVNEVIQKRFKFEIRKDVDQRTNPPQMAWYFVNMFDDDVAKEFGAAAYFDTITLKYFERLIEMILKDGPIKTNKAINESKSVTIGAEFKEAKRSIHVDEAEQAVELFVELGYLEQIENNLNVGRRTYQELRPLITSKMLSVESGDVNPPFQWVSQQQRDDDD